MSDSPSTSSAARIDTLRARVEDALHDVARDKQPDELYEPVRYVLRGGGKRLRPVLLLLTAEALGARVDRALPAALAVEVFHNFTLVHDDVMDEAPERRGRPAVHVKWDVPTALLVGDCMMGLSYELLSDLDPSVDLRAVYDVYHPMVEGLVRGQALDAAFESRVDVSVEDYLEMIDGKTAALLSAVFELGAVIADADADTRAALGRVGRNVGRAFQVQDDLLDVTADSEDWGKAVGGDLIVGKKTYVTLRAVERADGDDRAWLSRITRGGIAAEEVAEARDRMARLGVFDDARAAVSRYTDAARADLDALPDTHSTTVLRDLIDRMQARSH